LTALLKTMHCVHQCSYVMASDVPGSMHPEQVSDSAHFGYELKQDGSLSIKHRLIDQATAFL